VTARVILVALIAVLAGCGGSSKPSGDDAAFNADEQAYVAQLQKLCRQAKSFPAYVDAVAKLEPPARFQTSQKQRLAALRRAGAGFGSDDRMDAELGLVDCIAGGATHAVAARGATVREMTPALNAICADNAARARRARRLAGASEAVRWRIDTAAPARLSREIVALGAPADAGPEYGGWRDAQKTVANLTKLGADAWFAGDNKRADAMKAQAARTAAAGRNTARRLGLAECAKLNG
jgi:hypothetical protein